MTLQDAPPRALDAGSEGLLRILDHLKAAGYAFVTPTPATHRRVVAREDKSRARDLRDIFGWSLPFDSDLPPTEVMAGLRTADALEPVELGFRAKVRASSLGGDLFLHSAFPPSAEDAVFFGPDTYRFARFLQEACDGRPVGLAVDVGVGSGAGAAVVARHFQPRRLVATDINRAALRLAAVNLASAGISAELRRADGLDGLEDPADLIVANPPFIAGDGRRTYRDGGDMLGARLSYEWTLAGAARLAPGGRMMLYTGSAIVGGEDRLRQALERGLPADRFDLRYAELDPDIFGGQLAAPAYRDVERIAAVGVVVTRRP